MPYMTRETCKADLARTISVLPNLRYVDLPDGFFGDDPTTTTLRQELQNRCRDIRRMKYQAGSEGSFTMLAHMHFWSNMEVLELGGLSTEPETLLYVLTSFPALQEIKLGDMQSLDDNLWTPNSSLPPFPAVTTLALEHAPLVTAAGLKAYLSRIETREVLCNLSLTKTGVLPQELHSVLAYATHLDTLTVCETVSRPFPITPVPPLSNRTLRSLRFEILPTTNAANPPSETYYSYIATSLLASALPSLTSLFAFSTALPDLLLRLPDLPFAPPSLFNSSSQSRFSAYSARSSTSTSSFPRPASFVPATLPTRLALYTKPALAPELEWSLTTIDPPSEHNGGLGSASATRPLSLVMEGEGGA